MVHLKECFQDGGPEADLSAGNVMLPPGLRKQRKFIEVIDSQICVGRNAGVFNVLIACYVIRPLSTPYDRCGFTRAIRCPWQVMSPVV